MALDGDSQSNGAERLIGALARAGAEHVFGMAGTQNVALLEAVRRSRLSMTFATHELAASFMANGYGRTRGRPGVLCTIPGPGFTYALTGLAEAYLDSAPLLHIVGSPATAPGKCFQLQAIDQAAIARPVTKAVVQVDAPADMADAAQEAYRLTMTGEPGPVMLQVSPSALGDTAPAPTATARVHVPARPSREALEQAVARLSQAHRIVIYAGQGTAFEPEALLRLAEALGAVVATTTSARGVVPEDHPLLVRSDGDSARLIRLLDHADLVLALGVKFSHNGAHGFRLPLDPARLIHVDASREVLEGHFEAGHAIECDVPAFMRELLPLLPARADTGWQRAARTMADDSPPPGFFLEPAIPAASPPVPAGFFAMLREAMPREAILVTDAGLHQSLARKHFPIYSPRGLLVPTGLQSMGFCLPAAIGAKIAEPTRPVVALIGDGGISMAGMELLTAVRERIPLTVIVFNDGYYGLIRLQQLERYGHAPGGEVLNPDFAQWAASLGVEHRHFDGMASLRAALAARRPTMLEVDVRDSGRIQVQRIKSLARETLKDVKGPLMRVWRRPQT